MSDLFDAALGSPAAILMSATSAELRVATLLAMGPPRRTIIYYCDECEHAAHHAPCGHKHCSCIKECRGADYETGASEDHVARTAKYKTDVAEATAALEKERAGP